MGDTRRAAEQAANEMRARLHGLGAVTKALGRRRPPPSWLSFAGTGMVKPYRNRSTTMSANSLGSTPPLGSYQVWLKFRMPNSIML